MPRCAAGLEALLADAREVRQIRQTMAREGLSAAQLNYRDMERLRQVSAALGGSLGCNPKPVGGGGRGGGMWVLCVGLARGSWGAAARIADGLLQFRRDVLKAVPVALIAIPPFANFLVLLLM